MNNEAETMPSMKDSDTKKNETIQKENGNMPKKENFFGETLKFIVISLIIVVPFRYFIAQPFIVSGASMDPTFEDGEYLIVDQLSYHFEEPARGDVIIFKYPKDPSKYFIKRVIGLPNETVIINGESVSITETDGKTVLLNEPYVANNINISFEKKLNADEYFVMGDNRPASSDSRIWGPLPKENIIGRPLLRLLPVTRINLFPGVSQESSKK